MRQSAKEKAKSILSGYKNLLIKDKGTEKLAEQRAAICAKCPSLKKGYVDALLKSWSIEKINTDYCGICKCVLAAKTRSHFENCPIKKW